MQIDFNTEIRFPHNGTTASGRVTSTMHRGATLIEVVVFSPELGHTNTIDHGVIVKASDIL